MNKQNLKLKKIISEKEFYNCISNVINHKYYSHSYYKEPFDILPFQMYTLKKEHFEYVFSELEEAEFYKILDPMCTFKKNNTTYYEYDITDGCFSICNFLCGIIRDGISPYILTPNEAFEYFKRTLNLFIKFHKFVLNDTIEFHKNKKNPRDFSWKKTAISEDTYYSDRYYDTLPLCASKYFSEENYRIEIEKIVERNIDFFTAYKFTYDTGLNSFNYLLSAWQKYYSFSYEFIERNYKYFYVPDIVANKKLTETKENLDLIFGKLLEWNLSEVIRTSALGGNIKPICITKEKTEELVLLFVAN